MAYGFGGLGASFPARTMTPDSQAVQSTGEWDSEWQKKLAAVPQTITTGASAPVWTNVSQLSNEQAGSVLNQAVANNLDNYWRDSGNTDTWGNSIRDFFVMTSPGFAGYTSANPAYTQLNNQYLDAKGIRDNAQAAQQQAYDGMQGNYAFNGNLPSAYSNPNFGQVSGTQTAQSVPGALQTAVGSGTYGGGVQQTGVYNPQEQRKTWEF